MAKASRAKKRMQSTKIEMSDLQAKRVERHKRLRRMYKAINAPSQLTTVARCRKTTLRPSTSSND